MTDFGGEILTFKGLRERIRSAIFSLSLPIITRYKIKIGKNLRIRKGVIINVNGEGRLVIGDNCFFNNYCTINCRKNIDIGNDCLFGENVRLYDHNHIFTDIGKSIREQGYSSDSISIGSNCWIGSNVTILKGVSIGDNVIVGANCLIYKSIQKNTVVKCKTELIINDRF